MIPTHHCVKCGYRWPIIVAKPKKCPNCQSKDWDARGIPTGTKTLADILKLQAPSRSPFPEESGYGGEQDGDVVLRATFGDVGFEVAPRVPDIEAARKIHIPEAARLVWAKYDGHGWYGVVGIWESQWKKNPKGDLAFWFMGL